MSIKHISPEGLEIADSFIDLQNMLSSLTEANLKKTVKKLYSTKFVENEEKINSIIENVLSIVAIKPNYTEMIGKFCIAFFEASKLDTPASEFAVLLLKRLLRFTKDDDYLKKVPDMVLLKYLIENEFYVDRDYIPQMNGLLATNFVNQFCLMFACLSKTIYNENSDLFSSILPVVKEMSGNKQIDAKLCQIFDNFGTYMKNEFELIDVGLEQHEEVLLVEALRNDDPDGLKEVQDFNMHLHFSIFEPCKILHNEPTLIQVAAFYGSFKCFKMLQESGAKLHKKDKLGWDSALFIACGGNVEILSLIEKLNVNFYKTPSYAAQYRSYDILDWLFEKRKKDIGDMQKELRNVMCASARTNNYRTFLNCLERHQKVRNKDRKGENALHAAVSCGLLSFTKFVLMFDNCDPNSTDSHERSALHIAAMNGYEDILEHLMINPEINVSLKDDEGNTALHLAALNGQSQTVDLLTSAINVNDANKKGRTPLHCACVAGNARCVQMLIKAGADRNKEDNDGKKAVELATDPDVIEILTK